MEIQRFACVIFLFGFGCYIAISYSRRISYSLYSHKTMTITNSQIDQKMKNKSQCIQNHFKDILLVIVFNYPHYDSIDILNEFYHPVFPHILICGPRTPNTSRTDITYVEINRGIFGYKCLNEAIRQKHTDGSFKGYFYINDDVILNYWNLINSQFDENFIWSSNNQYGRVDLQQGVPEGWYWWVSPYGFKNCKLAVHKVTQLAKSYNLYKSMLKQYLDNGNSTFFAYNGRSDILYIPRKVALKFHELTNIFEKQLVFLEIAIPTILRFLAPSNEIKTLNGHYIPGDVRKNDARVIDARYFWVTYLQNPTWWFVHPFKLQHKKDKNRELNLQLLKHILIKKTRTLTCIA